MVPISPVYRGRFGIESDRVKSGNRCRIDVESTSEEGKGEADSKVRCGGLCLINPSQSYWSTCVGDLQKGSAERGFPDLF